VRSVFAEDRLHDPRPISEQRENAAPGGCAAIWIAVALLMLVLGAGAAAFVALRAVPPSAVAAPPALPPPSLPPPSLPPPSLSPPSLSPPSPPPLSGAAGPAQPAGPRPSSPGDPLAAEEEAAGGDTRASIQRVIRAHLSEIRYCYESELRGAPDLSGRLTVSFDIDPAGAVQDPSIASSTLAGPAGDRVGACVLGRLRRWVFPEPADGALHAVTYPFVFEPSP
jgi:outer membrane biosynthesis protein TonB